MIVALVSLLTALFLGGPAQIFYVDNIEKGIKKNVLEKYVFTVAWLYLKTTVQDKYALTIAVLYLNIIVLENMPLL